MEAKEINLNVKLNFYGEQLDFQLSPNYNTFIQNILNNFNLSQNQLSAISFTYFDEEGDKIMISTEEDYTIFLQQVKEKTVNNLVVEINENNQNQIDKMACLNSALNYQEQVKKANSIEINNQNNNNQYNNSNLELNNNPVNKEVQINDIIFEYKCTTCDIYPIICVLYYCPKCNMHLCESCNNKNIDHTHPMLKFESKNEFMKIKEQELKEYEEKMKNSQNNNQNNNNPYYYNNPYPYYYDNNYNNQNQQNINQPENPYPHHPHNPYPHQPHHPHDPYPHNPHFPHFPHFPFFPPHWNPKPFQNLVKKKMPFLINNNSGKFFETMKYAKIIHEARKRYNLEGITNEQLVEALKKTNDDMDNAIILLTK